MIYTTNSERETFELGQNLARNFKKNDIIALTGELGAGKTAITKGIAEFFGINAVSSPTFTIVNEYGGDLPIFHIDAYRITEKDWELCGFDEYLDKGGVTVIEWYGNVAGLLDEYRPIKIDIKYSPSGGENSRIVEVSGLKGASDL